MKTRRLPLAIFAIVGACSLSLVGLASAHGGDMFKTMDENGDGKISPEEHASGAKKMFEKMDANGDGKVTAAEMDTCHAAMEMKKHKADKGEMSSSEKIKMVDTNGDGVLTAAEHEAGSKMMFDKMDTDKSGSLTKAEVEAGHAKMMSKAATKQ